MGRRRQLTVGVTGTIGVLLFAVGIVYLTVACEDLPGVLGPHPGDATPRTPRGVVGVVLGLVVLAIALAAVRRRPPSGPAHS